MRVRKMALFFTSCMLFFSLNDCTPPGEDLPVVSHLFEPDISGYIQFNTNDKQYRGYTFFEPDLAITETTMTTVEIQTVKKSGNADMGFGVFFCWQDISNYYFLINDVNGYFTMGRRAGPATWYIYPWDISEALHTGYNQINTLRVTYNSSSQNFSAFINGTLVGSFVDTTFSGGKSGFLASVSMSEKFPNKPVDIYFKMLQPSLVP
jgi:hypothetical protein